MVARWTSPPESVVQLLLAKRAYQFAAEYADARGDTQIEPHHLLYGALRDAQDPLEAGCRSKSNTPVPA